MSSNLGNLLREALGHDAPIDDELATQLRQRMLDQLDQAPNASTRPRHPKKSMLRQRRGAVLVAVSVLVITTGGAVAAERSGLFSSEPTIDRVDALRPQAPAGTEVPQGDADQYEVLDWPIPKSLGEQLPPERSRKLLEYTDPVRNLTLLATPTTHGDLCIGLHGNVSADPSVAPAPICGGFRTNWPLIEAWRGVGTGIDYYYGIAADGVVGVWFVAEGERQPATMGRNAYIWAPSRSTRSGPVADAVEVELTDGTIARREFGADPTNDPYQEPRIVSRGAGEK